jgi:Zn-dependent protease
MDISFTDFTPAAQATLTTAEAEATKTRAANVEPEHVLLGLLSPAAGAAWNVLAGVIRDPLALRQVISLALKDVPQAAENFAPSMSYRSRRVLSEAGDEARRAHSEQIDTPHLLLGLLDEGGAAAQLLRQRGLDAQKLRYWLRQPPAPNQALPAAPVAAPQPRTEPKPHPLHDAPLRYALPRLINWPTVTLLLAIVVMGGYMTTRSDLERPGIILFILGGWLISLSAHEFAHALVADMGGDHGVRDKGYLSFNPLKYTHIFLSVILPLIFLLMGGIGLPGGAVYIDRSRLRGPKWQSAVSLAGPLASLIVALILAAPFMLNIVKGSIASALPVLWAAWAALVMLNVAGIILNLLPIPPLDGFGILAPWLTPSLRMRLYALSSFGILVLFIALSSQPINAAFWDAIDNILRTLGVNPLLAQLGLSRLMFWQ